MGDPIWKILDEEGRKLVWLAARIDYSIKHVYAVKAGNLPASRTFRARCAELLGRPESELFHTAQPKSSAGPTAESHKKLEKVSA